MLSSWSLPHCLDPTTLPVIRISLAVGPLLQHTSWVSAHSLLELVEPIVAPNNLSRSIMFVAGEVIPLWGVTVLHSWDTYIIYMYIMHVCLQAQNVHIHMYTLPRKLPQIAIGFQHGRNVIHHTMPTTFNELYNNYIGNSTAQKSNNLYQVLFKIHVE